MAANPAELDDLERLAFRVSPAPQVITANRLMLDFNEAFQRLFGYELSLIHI